MSEVNIKNIYKIVFVIIGTIIGAGFASGQEIYTFFNKYETKGLIGILISVSLISYIIYKTFKIIFENNVNNYEEFITNIIPERFKENKIFRLTIKYIINIFLLISFNIMVAGFATYFIQELHISKWYGAILIAILTYITLSNNIDGVIKINSYLIPIIILLIVFLGINKVEFIKLNSIQAIDSSIYWILSSILYSSYNSITLIPILISLKNKIKKKQEIGIITLCVAIIILILSIIIFLLINTFINEIQKIEIPILYIANSLGKGFKYIYGLVILMAIFTTAISSGYGFLSNTTKNRKKYIMYTVIICVASVLVGQIRFSNLINLLYPIFGYLGILQIIFLIIR